MPWTKILLDGQSADTIAGGKSQRVITFVEALCEAQAQILETDPLALLMGEGIDDPAGVFGSTAGLAERFGRDRVMDIPLAENGLTGVAVGLAASGMHPLFIHMRMDFLPMCLDQIVNHAAKWSYMTGGRVGVGLVIRAVIGRGWGSAAQHSQALHGLFMHFPGLRVAMPASPYDAKGLLFSAMADGNPVLFAEHRWSYGCRGMVPQEPYTVPFGQGVVRREGTDVTILAVSQMVHEALRAALALEEKGVSAEVIDPRTIKPFDADLLIQSVSKTGRLIIADPAYPTGGFAAEAGCLVAERIPSLLTAPVRRICFPDAPTPASPVLEAAYYPNAATIVEAAEALVRHGRGQGDTQ